jgi:hypothetical protein
MSNLDEDAKRDYEVHGRGSVFNGYRGSGDGNDSADGGEQDPDTEDSDATMPSSSCIGGVGIGVGGLPSSASAHPSPSPSPSSASSASSSSSSSAAVHVEDDAPSALALMSAVIAEAALVRQRKLEEDVTLIRRLIPDKSYDEVQAQLEGHFDNPSRVTVSQDSDRRKINKSGKFEFSRPLKKVQFFSFLPVSYLGKFSVGF